MRGQNGLDKCLAEREGTLFERIDLHVKIGTCYTGVQCFNVSLTYAVCFLLFKLLIVFWLLVFGFSTLILILPLIRKVRYVAYFTCAYQGTPHLSFRHRG